ncbi:MAG: SprT family zinc-dependent metalloprotease [bacterium]
MPKALTPEQTSQIVRATRERIDQANAALRLDLPYLEISFDVTGHTWGYYVRRHQHRKIRFNPTMFSQHMDEGLSDTVPHEVAHYVVDTISQGFKRPKPHGSEWRSVMRLFGITNPRATHKTDVTGIPSRRQRTHRYSCGCQEHSLSTTRHNRVQQKKMLYSCRRCGEPLKYLG